MFRITRVCRRIEHRHVNWKSGEGLTLFPLRRF